MYMIYPQLILYSELKIFLFVKDITQRYEYTGYSKGREMRELV